MEEAMSVILGIPQKLQPLKIRRNPAVAAVWGLLLDGIGLAIYLRSAIDLVLSVLVVVALTMYVGELGLFLSFCLVSTYGYFRVVASHEMLDKANQLQSCTSQSPEACAG